MAHLYQHFDLPQYGIDDFEHFYVVYRDHNEKLWSRFRKGYIKRDELRWKRMWHTLLDFKVGYTRLANEMSAAYLELLPTQRALIPFAQEIVDYCAQKYSLHIITNGFETTQMQKLYNCGLQSYFGSIISSEKSNSIKPNKEIFDYALSAVGGAHQSECVMIGDALEIDILGALNAGWDAIYFNPQTISHHYTPTYEVSCLAQIKHIL